MSVNPGFWKIPPRVLGKLQNVQEPCDYRILCTIHFYSYLALALVLAHTLIALAHTLIELTHLNSTEKMHRLYLGGWPD